MNLSAIGPNWAILRQPWNWFVVAFVLTALLFIAHMAFSASTKDAS